MQHIFLSQPSFFGHDITFLPSACLRVATHILCCNRTFLWSADFYVATHIYAATSKHLFSLKYVATLTLLVSTRLDHPLSTLYRDLVFLSRPKLLLQHLFYLNKLFHVVEVSVMTYEGYVAIDILPSVHHYVATQTILFPADFHMFFSFSVATCCLLSRPSSIVNNQIMVLRHRKCCCNTISLVIA